MSDWGGPYVCGAFFCRDVSVDPDGAHWTFGWIHDGIVTRGDPGGIASPYMVLMLSGGTARGKFALEIFANFPKQQRKPFLESPATILFDGPTFGWKSINQVFIPTGVEGTAWYDVEINGRVVTRIPYNITHSFDRSS